MISDSAVTVEFVGGPFDGACLRSNSGNPHEVRDAVWCYTESGRGTLGTSFAVQLEGDPHGAEARLRRREPVYQCVAREQREGGLRLRLAFRSPRSWRVCETPPYRDPLSHS